MAIIVRKSKNEWDHEGRGGSCCTWESRSEEQREGLSLRVLIMCSGVSVSDTQLERGFTPVAQCHKEGHVRQLSKWDA